VKRKSRKGASPKAKSKAPRKTERGEKIDPSLPARQPRIGSIHPLTQTTEHIKEIFKGLGFSVVEGPEVESDHYNFASLGISLDGPVRDANEAFYLADGLFLRTHALPALIRAMERERPPLSIIAAGRCYSRSAPGDSSPHFFHQVDGLAVGESLTFAHLKGVIGFFASRMFGEGAKVRFRPSYLPFAKPGAHYDLTCTICGGAGCPACGWSGWFRASWAGMVSPDVFRAVGYDPKAYTGFVFGVGVERIAMLRYRIDDPSIFYRNDLEFLKRF
jgi:phenylalanyl-tRNA synthetase alpha chain